MEVSQGYPGEVLPVDYKRYSNRKFTTLPVRKGIYGWCLMSNYAYLIISAKGKNASDVPGDLEKFTSEKMIKATPENSGESLKEWMLKIFKEARE